jgi:hypothetical protein
MLPKNLTSIRQRLETQSVSGLNDLEEAVLQELLIIDEQGQSALLEPPDTVKWPGKVPIGPMLLDTPDDFEPGRDSETSYSVLPPDTLTPGGQHGSGSLSSTELECPKCYHRFRPDQK